MEASHHLILLGSALVLLSIFTGVFSARFGAPLLLVFLGLGMLAGQEGPGGIRFRDFHAAYLIGSIALAIILFDGGLRTDPNAFRRALWPSLRIDRAGIHDAVGCDRPDRLRTLLAHDPGLANASDEDGGTPLHRLHGALTHGTVMIDLLVQHHADVNARERRGVTVLANVMASGAADLADRLRSLGAN